jgi:hypothetical protein
MQVFGDQKIPGYQTSQGRRCCLVLVSRWSPCYFTSQCWSVPGKHHLDVSAAQATAGKCIGCWWLSPLLAFPFVNWLVRLVPWSIAFFVAPKSALILLVYAHVATWNQPLELGIDWVGYISIPIIYCIVGDFYSWCPHICLLRLTLILSEHIHFGNSPIESHVISQNWLEGTPSTVCFPVNQYTGRPM